MFDLPILPPASTTVPTTTESAFVQPLQNYFHPLFEKLQWKNGRWGGECAFFARSILGIPPMGNANQWKSNSPHPILGSAVLFENHIGVVVGLMGDSIVTIDSNASRDGKIQVGKTYKIDDPKIRGYHVPFGTFAAR